jgi:hypothetical protein
VHILIPQFGSPLLHPMQTGRFNSGLFAHNCNAQLRQAITPQNVEKQVSEALVLTNLH